jgi:hypothetical protein
MPTEESLVWIYYFSLFSVLSPCAVLSLCVHQCIDAQNGIVDVAPRVERIVRVIINAITTRRRQNLRT